MDTQCESIADYVSRLLAEGDDWYRQHVNEVVGITPLHDSKPSAVAYYERVVAAHAKRRALRALHGESERVTDDW